MASSVEPKVPISRSAVKTVQVHGDTPRGRIWILLWSQAHADAAFSNLHDKVLARSWRYAKSIKQWNMPDEMVMDLSACFELAFWLTRRGLHTDWIQGALRDVMFYGQKTIQYDLTPDDIALNQTIHAGQRFALTDNNLTRHEWAKP